MKWLCACSTLLIAFLACTYAGRAHSQACTPPPQGATAWWTFDETNIGLARDAVGGHHLVPSGPLSTSLGNVGNALSLHSPGFMAGADSSAWNFDTRHFTIELWANFATAGGGTLSHPSHIFIGHDEGPGLRNKWFFALGGGYLNFHINGPGVGPHFFPLAPFTPSVGRWYHLAVTKAGSVYRIYVDGVLLASSVMEEPIPAAVASLTVGQAESLGFFNGMLDEMTIYNRSLSAMEIASISGAGAAGKCKASLLPTGSDFWFEPREGGNTGFVTLTISGLDLPEPAAVRLQESSSPPLLAANVASMEDGRISGRFDLRSMPAGDYRVEVLDGAGHIYSTAGTFRIIAGGQAQLTIEIVAPGTVRAGRDTVLSALLRNSGSTDIIHIAPTAALQLENFAAIEASPVRSILTLPPGAVVPVAFPLRIPFTATGCSLFSVSASHWSGPPPDEDSTCDDWQEWKDHLLDLIANALLALGEAEAETNRLECDLAFNPIDAERCAELYDIVQEGHDKLDQLTAAFEAANDYIDLNCPEDDDGAGASHTFSLKELMQQTQSQRICIVNSWDPNEKIGTAAVGPRHAIRRDERLTYVIHFENQKTATAPAQSVVITDQLPAELDWTSVALGNVTLSSVTIRDAVGSKHFSSVMDLRPAQNALVSVEADVSAETGKITWSLAALDPLTGEPPQDPLAGFLPPNTVPGRGEGSVSFSVLPKLPAPSASVIKNSATIVFDANPPIVTPEWSNVIDEQAPACRVSTLSPMSSPGNLPLHWSGTDDGAGIKNYSIYVSTDNSGYFPIVAATTSTDATYPVADGHTYAFYCLAEDQLGNAQLPPASADTTTKVQSAKKNGGGGATDVLLFFTLLIGMIMRVRKCQ